MQRLIIIAIVVIAAVAGYLLAHYQTAQPNEQLPPLPDEQPYTTPPTEPPPRIEGNTEESPTSEHITEPITIDIAQLPEGQQTVLRTLGIDGETITFTPEMVACAEAELGVARLDEIIAGDTPSFGEGFTLVNCYRK